MVSAGTQIQEKLNDVFLGDSMWTIAADSGDANINSGDTVTIAGGTGITTSESSKTLTITNTQSGDVVGPGSATDNAMCVYDGTTGKLIGVGTITDDGAIVTFTGADVRAATLPDSDPGVLGQLYTDGTIGPGAPKTLKVSGG